eukprot:XP_017945915.1 PREDICTED: uncharacterized protein LOC101734340 [Xenopus tropicalis]
MAEGRSDSLFLRGDKQNSQVLFLACTQCKTKFKAGQKDPVCMSCNTAKTADASAPTLDSPMTQVIRESMPADPPGPSASVITGNPAAPAWAISLSQSLSALQGIPLLATSLDKVLEKLSSPGTPRRQLKRKATVASDSLNTLGSSSDSEEEPLSDGELSPSASEGEDPSVTTDHSNKVDDLITAVMEVLKVEEPTPTSKQSKGLFRRATSHSISFPVHEQLQAIIQEEWNTPEHKFQITKKFAKLYPIPKEEVEKWGSPPVVDAPVSRLSKSTALPVPDASAFKDATDKKLEGFLKAIYTASGAALRPVIAMTWVGRALEAWSELILTGIREEASVEDIEASVLRMQEASSYLSDASLDVLKTVARSSALSVAARRALWLRLWSADLSSKRSLTSLPFKGSRLFGEELEKIFLKLRGVRVHSYPKQSPKTTPQQERGGFFGAKDFVTPRVHLQPDSFIIREDTAQRASQPGNPENPQTRLPMTNNRQHDWQIRSQLDLPVGGKLQYFAENWTRHIADPWVTETISSGYHLEFRRLPPTRFLMSRVPRDPQKQSAFLSVVEELIQSNVVIPVPPDHQFTGFYSNLFVVPKKNGTFRPVLDLKRLNKWIIYRRFKMESVRSVIRAMEPGEFLTSLDMKDAYLHVPIFPPHQAYLRFAFQGQHFQFTALPFGLSSAPRIFTKIMATMAAHLRVQGVCITPYLDDLLVKARSKHQAERDLEKTMQTLQEFGWTINRQKSSLVPSQRMPFLGFLFDTLQGKVLLPEEKTHRLISSVQDLQTTHKPSIRHCMKVLGMMVSSTEAVRFAQFHIRPLQRNIISEWKRHECLSHRINLDVRAWRSLEWWTMPAHLSQGRSIEEPTWQVITTDASLSGWGATFQTQIAQGLWSESEKKLPINILEIRAIFQAVLHWENQLTDRDIRIQSDNATAVAYLNRQGGTKSLAAANEISKIFRWAETRINQISAVHIPGVKKLGGGLSKSTLCGSDRMGTERRGLRSHHGQLGSARPGPHGVSSQPKDRQIHSKDQGPSGRGGGCHDSEMGILTSVCIPSDSDVATYSKKNKARRGYVHCHRTILAKEILVYNPDEPLSGSTNKIATKNRSSTPGSYSTSQSRNVQFDGMEIEKLIWTRKGFSSEVAQTMIKARKKVSSKAYHRIWKLFMEWCFDRNLSYQGARVPMVLQFLQDGLKKGLSLGTLKVQVSALSILLQSRLALQEDVRTFLQGVAHIAPPVRSPVPPWDLNAVLSALINSSFEPLPIVELRWLTWKVVFLLAISSARRVSELNALSCESPYLIFHEEKAVLRTMPSFLPKVVSSFHLNEEIVIPSFCSSPKNEKEARLHNLDVVRALHTYVDRTAHFRRSESLFVIPSGSRKGLPASKATITRWIKERYE